MNSGSDKKDASASGSSNENLDSLQAENPLQV